MAERLNRRKVRIGVVVSDKMDKTVVVRVTREFRHPLYGKRVKKSKKYMAHDELNQCQVGDVVKIMETRPLSRHKRWRVVEIIEKAKKLGEEAPAESQE
ncbi:30S ribosomal protein S17 [Thermovibrio sp.]